MQRLLAVALLITSCSSTSPTSSSSTAPAAKANIPEPEFQIEQIIGPGDQTFPVGNFEVKFQLQIGNRADVPLTLSKLEIRTSNPAGGAYTLRSPFTYFFNKTIAPRSADTVDFWARAVGYGRGTRDSEPVTVRGVAYYKTPTGYYNQVFVREISQYQ